MLVTMPVYMFFSALLMSLVLAMAVVVYFFNRRNKANVYFSLFLILLVGWLLSGGIYMYFPVRQHVWVAIQMMFGILLGPAFYLFGRYLVDEQYRLKRVEWLLFLPAVWIVTLGFLRIFHPASSAVFETKIAIIDHQLQREMDIHYLGYTIGVFGLAWLSLMHIGSAMRKQQNPNDRKRFRTVFLAVLALSASLFVANSLVNMLGRRLDPNISMLAIVITTSWIAFSVLGHKAWKIEYLLEIIRRNEAQLEQEKAKTDKLLLNILPAEVADELKETGRVVPRYYEWVSVMFTDFQGFTNISEKMSAQQLVHELDGYFTVFDSIIEQHGLEKLKTIGDGYMCAGGIPVANHTHPLDIVLAALEIREHMRKIKLDKERQGIVSWDLRIGIHSGPLVAGVIGARKFVYDIWGDTVNIAARMESSGMNDRINISRQLKTQVDEFFELEFRGELQAKRKGAVEMYFVHGLKPAFSSDDSGLTPNDAFWKRHQQLKTQDDQPLN